MHPGSSNAGVVWPMEAEAGLPRARLQEVAREAGVSLATVDRAVHRRPGVSDKTLRRVQQALRRALGRRLGKRPMVDVHLLRV